ncbi:MAG: metal-dependent hydrolase [Nevskia sp.]|nr:metal-dependent hydrolase [Nevskia sp.]
MSTETVASSIPVRRLNVDFSAGFPRWWHSGNPYLTHYWDSLSMFFPQGERQTIDWARACLADLQNSGQTALLADAKAFIGQEAAHRRVHVQYNEVLKAHGYRNWVEPLLGWQLRRAESFPHRLQLSLGAAFEHWTTILGDYYLSVPSRFDGMADPPRRVWEWHSLEETEHKTVLFDLYRWKGGGYLLRLFGFLFMTSLIVLDLSVAQASMLFHDRVLHRPSTWGFAMRFWFGRQGLLWHHLPLVWAYMKPGFHPSQHDSSALVEDFRQRLQGKYQVLDPARMAQRLAQSDPAEDSLQPAGG